MKNYRDRYEEAVKRNISNINISKYKDMNIESVVHCLGIRYDDLHSIESVKDILSAAKKEGNETRRGKKVT